MVPWWINDCPLAHGPPVRSVYVLGTSRTAPPPYQDLGCSLWGRVSGTAHPASSLLGTAAALVSSPLAPDDQQRGHAARGGGVHARNAGRGNGGGGTARGAQREGSGSEADGTDATHIAANGRRVIWGRTTAAAAAVDVTTVDVTAVDVTGTSSTSSSSGSQWPPSRRRRR
ncbi:hypothetical protein GGTG_13973 [Gaeumannomyces tritici R3-111a-1]|uniref:Uncharacterized protein n=1 Tax=Gaeumannomyces tritici (strain R3-111a-1) TaxID=644352 RepID=J3PKC1_GAET3|nr:hypothetical protein GGTG_13973 [Gaeumannomyces tritici R3-111a-1]EJT68448.1 hypothetical protein GGTG_13973 [Gaeumannomyces tritici R3-111a-1]